jgi:hypothetical protein
MYACARAHTHARARAHTHTCMMNNAGVPALRAHNLNTRAHRSMAQVSEQMEGGREGGVVGGWGGGKGGCI